MAVRCSGALEHDLGAGSAIRRGLNFVYVAAAAMGGACLISVLGLVVVQAAGRWMAIPIGGLTELATYGMAASLFLPLGYAFKAGAHIRVCLLLDRLPKQHRWILELWCLTVASGLSAFLAWSAVAMTRTSFVIGDVSPGADATPLWIPQLAMACGTVVLAIAVLDELVLRLLERWAGAFRIPLTSVASFRPK